MAQPRGAATTAPSLQPDRENHHADDHDRSAEHTGYASDDTLAVTAELESNRVLQKIRDKTDAVVERIQPKIAAVSDYARNEPTKAVLIVGRRRRRR